MHDFRGRKPACSLRSRGSKAVDSLLLTIWEIILFAILMRVIPRQFLHCDRSPFLGMLIIRPSFISSQSVLVCQKCSIIWYIILALTSGDALSNSGGILSGPGALLFFKHVMASIMSVSLGGSVEKGWRQCVTC